MLFKHLPATTGQQRCWEELGSCTDGVQRARPRNGVRVSGLRQSPASSACEGCGVWSDGEDRLTRGLLSPGGMSVSGFEREGGIGPGMVEHVALTGLVCGFFVYHLMSSATGRGVGLSRAEILPLTECSSDHVLWEAKRLLITRCLTLESLLSHSKPPFPLLLY